MKRSTPLRRTAFKRTERPERKAEGSPELARALACLLPKPAERPRAKVGALLSPPRARMAVNLAAEPPRAEPKEVRFESEALRRAVASLPCVLCGKVGETQAAHANRHGKGAMRKADDSLVAACCVACHHELDQGKTMTRDERRAELDRAIVLTVKALARAGMLIVKENV